MTTSRMRAGQPARVEVAGDLAQEVGERRCARRSSPPKITSSQRLTPIPGVSQRPAGSCPVELAVEDGHRPVVLVRSQAASCSVSTIDRW